ncbi:MFS transporter [Micromonospora sp. NPDC050397]|uniref:MFS transporter n=1 Tax=Micromonospora sp. NPDC050397 TaxID=3364279 RepID=UPI00384EEF27
MATPGSGTYRVLARVGMHTKAYEAQCAAEQGRHPAAAPPTPRKGLTLLALALGTFAIGTGEFASSGVIQLLASGMDVSVPVAAYAITGDALGAVTGLLATTLRAARASRRTVLLGAIGLFLIGNVLSALAPNIAVLIVSRFVTGSVQGAFIGAGAGVAAYVYGPGEGGRAFGTVMSGLTVATVIGAPLGTLVGQHAGWRVTYWAVVVVGLLAGAALLAWLPRTDDLRVGRVAPELGPLRRLDVRLMVGVAALGSASLFAVYTFIGPLVTDAAGASASLIPVALAVFGLGMAFGNYHGGPAADRYGNRPMIFGYSNALVHLVAIGLTGSNILILLPALFGVGASLMYALPTAQVLLTRLGPDAPSLMGALNLVALDLASSLGATGGAVVLGLGWGTLSTVWAGSVLTAAGLILYGAVAARTKRADTVRPGPLHCEPGRFRRRGRTITYRRGFR